MADPFHDEQLEDRQLGLEASDEDQDSRVPIEMLASEFVDRRRTGESVSIDDYVREHPDLAAEIRELFPAVLAMENIRDESDSRSDSQPATTSVPIPERLGDLRIIRQIGRGGMGVVYEAEQESLGRRVAVKVLPQMGIAEDRRVQRFHREAAAAAKLHHTNIVPVLGVGQHEGHHYYVMQLIRGVGLDEIIHSFALRLEKQESTQGSWEVGGAQRQGQDSRSGGAQTQFSRTRSVSKLDVEPTPSEPAGRVTTCPSAQQQVTEELSSVSINRRPDQGLVHTIDPSQLETDPTGSDNSKHDRSSLTDRVVKALERHSEVAQSVSFPIKLRGKIWNIVARVGLQSAEALAYAHEMNILHRDIKPANLIVDEHGIVWVTDFGLAKVLDDVEQSHTGDLAGTLRYMPPERFSGESDHRSDIHALGLTLFELIAGRPAFNEADRGQLIRRISQGSPPPLRRLRRDVPRDLETIVARCIERDPERRYQTAGDLADDMRRFLDDLPIRARKIGSLERSWRWCRRNPMLATLSTSTALLLMVVLTMFVVGYFRSSALLAREQRQRQLADETNKVAVETLDSLYNEFAPRRVQMLEARSLIDADGSEVTVDLPPVISDESARMLERFLPLYDRLALLDEGKSEQYQIKSIEANRRIGEIRHQLGQFDGALDAYQTANQKLQVLIEKQPEDPLLLLRASSLRNEMGVATRGRSERDEWRVHHEQAIAILSEIENQIQGDEMILQQLSYERARAYYNLGKISAPLFVSNPLWMFREFGASRFSRSARGRESESFDPQKWRERMEELRRRNPPPTQTPPTQTPRQERVSSVLTSEKTELSGTATSGQPSETLREPPEAKSRDRFSQSNSGESGEETRTLRGETAGERRNDRSRMGPRPSRHRRGPSGDLDAMERAVVEAEQLHRDYPDNVEYEFFLASCYRERALLNLHGEKASADLESALAILDNLVQNDPGIPDYRFELSRTLAMEHIMLGREAANDNGSSLSQAINHTIGLTRQHPNVLAYADFLGLLYIRQAQEYVFSGGKERVDELLWLASEQYLRLMERAPNSWFYQFVFENAVLNWLAVVSPRVEFAARHARDRNPNQRPEWEPESEVAFGEGLKKRSGSIDLREDIQRLLELHSVVESSETGILTWQVKAGLNQALVWAYQKSDQTELAAPYQTKLEEALEKLREQRWEPGRFRGGGPNRRLEE